MSEIDRADRCGCGEPDCGYPEVADRMDRWAANDYRGDWLDDRYAPVWALGLLHAGTTLLLAVIAVALGMWVGRG